MNKEDSSQLTHLGCVHSLCRGAIFVHVDFSVQSYVVLTYAVSLYILNGIENWFSL